MVSRFFNGLLAFFAAVFITAGVVGGYIDRVIHQTISTDEPIQHLYIKSGSGVSHTAYQIKAMGLIRDHRHFVLTSTVFGKNKDLKAGEFEISAGMTLIDVLNKIVSGETVTRKLTIPEGLTSLQIGSILSSAFGVEYDLVVPAEEGSLAPDTYHYKRGVTASELISRMQKAQNQVLDDLSFIQRHEIITGRHDILTLASIVERETALPVERPVIAAVFLNRLKKKMRLQSDPTVIYGINPSGRLDRPISMADLKAETPYNTYKIRGLPAGPIANPGKQSIAAVINPTQVPYLYFVADGSGGHAFAKTLREHNRNVRKWRKYQKNNP